MKKKINRLTYESYFKRLYSVSQLHKIRVKCDLCGRVLKVVCFEDHLLTNFHKRKGLKTFS